MQALLTSKPEIQDQLCSLVAGGLGLFVAPLNLSFPTYIIIESE